MTTKEEIQLRFKDLCARLPYGVKVKCERYPFPVTVLYAGKLDEVKFEETGGIEHIGLIKPYLRPMSSLTEAEKEEYRNTFVYMAGSKTATSNSFDFLNSRHLDYRGLIPMGLALEAPEGMYKTE